MLPLRLLETIIGTLSHGGISIVSVFFARPVAWWRAVLAQYGSASINSLKLWSQGAAAGEPSLTIMGHHARGVTGIALSPDGHLLASASYDHTTKLWDLDSNRLLATKEIDSRSPNHILAVAFAPGGSVFAAGSTDGVIRIWKAGSNGDEAPTTRISAHHPKPVKALAFSPDGVLLASGSGDGEITLWAWQDGEGERKRRFPGRGVVAGVSKLVFSPDGRHLACASEEQTVNLWDVATGALAAHLAGCGGDARGLAYSKDGRWLAHADGDAKVKVAEIKAGGIPLSGCAQEIDLGQVVYDVAFSHDGRLLAVALGRSVIEILERENGQPVRTLTDYSGAVTAVAFSQDSRLLASGSWDNSVKLWRVQSRFGFGDYWRAFAGRLRRV